MTLKSAPHSGGVEKREVAGKTPDKQPKPDSLMHKIEEVLQTIEDNRDLFEKYAKKMDRVKKIYERIKKIEEIFNGLQASLSEAKASNRAYVLNKLGVSKRLIREISYIDKNHQYLEMKKSIPKQMGDKYKCTPDDNTLSVLIAHKGKKEFAAVRSDTRGNKTIMYKDSRGNWQEFGRIKSMMGLKSKLAKLEANRDLLNKAETEVRKLRGIVKPDFEVKLDASDIKDGKISILFYQKGAPNKKFASIYWKPGMKSTDVYAADSKGKWHNIGSISNLSAIRGKLKDLEKNHDVISKGAETVRKLNKLLAPEYKAELNATSINKQGEISIWLNTKDKPNVNFATIWWKPGSKGFTFYVWKGERFVADPPNPKTLSGVKARLNQLVKKQSESPAALKEKAERVKGQEGIAKALISLAKDENVPAKLQGSLKAYLATIQPNKYKTFEVVINRSLVRVAVARSKDGKYYKAFLDASLTAEGEPSTVLGKGPSETPIDSVAMHLKQSGKPIDANDKPGKFPDVPEAFAPEGSEKMEKITPQIIKATEAMMDLSSYNAPSKESSLALKQYLSGLKKSELKIITRVVEGTPVTFQIGKSESGKSYRLEIKYQGKKPSRIRFGGVTILDATGNIANKTLAGEKYPSLPSAKKTPEKAPTTSKGKLALIFKKIEKEGMGALKDNIAQFRILIEKMGLEFQKDKITKVKVGAYTIATCGWSKHAGVKPSIVVFKGEGPQVVLYKRGKYNRRHFGTTNWQVSRMLPAYQNTTWTRRFAERMGANNALDQVLSQIKGKEFTFTSPDAQKMFEAALHKLSIYSGKSWKAAYEGGTEVHFNKANGYFKVVLPGGRSFYYHAGAPGTFIRPGTKKRCAFGVYSAKQVRGLSRLRKRMSEDREAAEKRATLKKQQEEAARKKAEVAKKKAAETRRKAQLEHNKKQATRESTVDQKYGKYIKNSKDPLVFTVDFGNAKNEKGKKLIDAVKIHHLFKLDELKKQGKVLLVTITDAKGKKRFGMYYPGQKTVYELDKKGGKQTKNPLKFSNKDKFAIKVVNPTEAHFKARTSVDRKVFSPASLELYKNNLKHGKLRTEFGKLKGKLTDLDLKGLDKFKKYKPYSPQSILFGDKRLIIEQNILKTHGVQILNQILKAEIAVLDAGIKKLKTKPTSPGAPTASRRPGKRPGGAETEKPSPELLSQIGSLREGDGVTFIKDGVKMAVFKDANGKFHYITDLDSGDSSGPKSASDFKSLTIDTSKPITKINGAPLLAAIKEISPLGSKKGKTLVFNLKDGREVKVKMKDYSVFGRWAKFNYSIAGTPQGVLHTKNAKSQIQAFVKVSLKMKPSTTFRYE